MTFDSFTSTATPGETENGQLPAPPAEIHVAPAPAPKRRGRPAKVAPPSPALFASLTKGGSFWLDVRQDSDTVLDLAVYDGTTLCHVAYCGAQDRTLVAHLKEKQRDTFKASSDLCERLAEPYSRTISMDADKLREALAFLLPAASTDVTRYNLNGLFFDSNGAWVSTDGHRLHLQRGMRSPFDRGVIVPRDTLVTLEKAIKATRADTVAVSSVGADHIAFSLSGGATAVEIRARLVDGQFPDYTQVIPTADGAVVSVSGDARNLRADLEKAPVLGNKVTSRRLVFESVRHSTPHGIDYSCNASTLRHDKVRCSLSFFGVARQTIDLTLNARYLEQALSELDGLVTLTTEELAPVRINCVDRLAIIMPMRA